jgi:uncharacterized protein YndB with AHSA1/START domain
MNIEKFKPAIVYTIYIASTPEKVWQALTSAEFSKMYFFGNSVEVDLRVGGAYVVRKKAERHLQRQLAGAGRKARADAGHL